MKYNLYNNPSLAHWIGFIFSCLLLVSCGGPSPQKYAQKFCDCSNAFSKATIQLKSGTINQSTFNQLQMEHNNCLGEEDPLEAFKSDSIGLAEFEKTYLTELYKKCPEIARNMGY